MAAAAALFALGCGGSAKHPLETKYDRLKLGMTTAQVDEIMGAGMSVTTADVQAYPEYPKLSTTDLPADTQWKRWGDGYPCVLAGTSGGKLVLAQVLGVQRSPK